MSTLAANNSSVEVEAKNLRNRIHCALLGEAIVNLVTIILFFYNTYSISLLTLCNQDPLCRTERMWILWMIFGGIFLVALPVIGLLFSIFGCVTASSSLVTCGLKIIFFPKYLIIDGERIRPLAELIIFLDFLVSLICCIIMWQPNYSTFWEDADHIGFCNSVSTCESLRRQFHTTQSSILALTVSLFICASTRWISICCRVRAEITITETEFRIEPTTDSIHATTRSIHATTHPIHATTHSIHATTDSIHDTTELID